MRLFASTVFLFVLFDVGRCWMMTKVDSKQLDKYLLDEYGDLSAEDLARLRFNLIFPGTKWCGAGDIAESYDDLGSAVKEDMCCREHDFCPDVIPGGESKYNLTNKAFYTREVRWSVNVWGGIYNNRILGPVFLPHRMNGSSYLNFINNDLVDMIDSTVMLADYHRMWFQQDGAPPHVSRPVRQRLEELFPDRWIGRMGPNAWPPRRLSCECDEKFRLCLRNVDSKTSTTIGYIYFNLILTQCYKKEYPIKGCVKKGGWLNTKCIEYSYDTSGEQVHQWFDVPLY